MPLQIPRIPILLGPTASGKTAVSVPLARMLGAEIISADSRLVYIGLDIGTAKPSEAEMGGVVHHLIDIVPPNADFTVADYQRLAFEKIGEILGRGKNALVVGGTGLYIRALIDRPSYQNLPAVPGLRQDILDEIAEKGTEAVYKELEKFDPEAAEKIHPNNIPRLVRAIEVIRSTGTRFSDIVARDAEKKNECVDYGWQLIGLNMERNLLYRRIDQRVLKMIDGGWLDEVRNLLDYGCAGNEKPLAGLGYRDIVEVARGRRGLSDVIETIQRDTRRFAKRQITFFNKIPGVTWFNITENSDISELAKKIFTTISSRQDTKNEVTLQPFG